MLNALRARKRYLIYFFLLILLAINSMDRVNVSIAGSEISKDMGLGPVALGYLFSSFLWIYIFCLLPAGWLTDRFGTRRMVGGAMIVWSIFQALAGFAVTPFMLLLTRLGLGVGESPTNPASNRVVREWAPRTERGLASALWISGARVGPAVGSLLVAWLITQFGWRASFVITGAIGVALGLLWLAVVSTPDKATWLSQEERTKILEERDMAVVTTHEPSIGYLGLASSMTMWGLFLSQGLLTYVGFFYLAWLPGYLQSAFGLTVMQTGAYTALPYGISAVGSLVLCTISDRVLTREAARDGKRRYAVALGAVFSASILFAPLIHSLGAAMVLLSLSLTCNTAAMSLNFALCNDRLRTAGDAGHAFAFFTLGGNTFGFLAPIVTGYLVSAAGNFNIAMVACGVITATAAVVSLTMTRGVLGPKMLGDAALAGTG